MPDKYDDALKGMLLPTAAHEVPPHLKPVLRKTKRLEWVTIIYMLTVIGVMFLTMQSSQAMKAAWLEDVLSLVPATVYLVAYSLFDKRPPGSKYPYGFHKVFTVAFLLGSFALLGIGLFVFYESVTSLVSADKPTIGQVQVFGKTMWMGWVMIAVLLYSFVPAFFLGRAKHKPSKQLHNKILFTDANTQKADWQTGLAAIAGIIGVGFGFWWADAAAAIIIAVNVIKDGFERTREAIADIMEQIPTDIDSSNPMKLVFDLHHYFKNLSWVADVRIRMRECGQVMFGEVFIIPKRTIKSPESLMEKIDEAYYGAKSLDWKIHDLTIQPVKAFRDENENQDEKDQERE